MTAENLFVQKPLFISSSKVKIEIFKIAGLPVNNSSAVLTAVAEGERAFDRQQSVGLFTDLNNYPIKVAIAKAVSAQRYLSNNINTVTRRNLFGVNDATWFINFDDGPVYINKPASHPQGSVTGVREILNFFLLYQGQPMSNCATTVFFSTETIVGLYEIILTIGKIALFNDQLISKLRELVYANRHTISCGISIRQALDTGIISPSNPIRLTIKNYQNIDISNYQDVRSKFDDFLKPARQYSCSFDGDPNNDNLKFLLNALTLGVLPLGLRF